MKKLISYLFIALSLTAHCQETEFKEYPTGLMYSDSTMSQLAHIVDSLNIKFRTCELAQTFLAKGQTKAHYIELDKGDIKAAKRDMDNGLPYDEFVKKYDCKTEAKDLIVVAYRYTDYQEREIVELSNLVDGFKVRADKEHADQRLGKCTWIYDYWEGGEYVDESISGFYLFGELKTEPLVEEYARLIQYADCMVDTSTTIFLESAERSGGFGGYTQSNKVEKFLKYISDETSKPTYDSDNWEQYRKDFDRWETSRFAIISDELKDTDKFKKLLDAALKDVKANGGSTTEFESYVERYVSKEEALALKRSRIVVGGCSMDRSPRIHAKEIAVLSAETVNWETFLRAHLDIMNDNFSRVSDGSYAWAGRKTYIAELEELEIDVPDLMLGISLRIENPSQNHYYGSIGRIGRALAESRYKDEIEQRILSMIEDTRLDDYNRIIMYYLFLNYNHNLEDEGRKTKNEQRLERSLKKLPQYLQSRIEDD